MVCKITSSNNQYANTHINTNMSKKNPFPGNNSSKSLTNFNIPNQLKSKLKKMKETNEGNIKKIDLEILMISEEFFDFLPRVRKNNSRSKNTNSLTNETNFSKLLRSGSILLNSGI